MTRFARIPLAIATGALLVMALASCGGGGGGGGGAGIGIGLGTGSGGTTPVTGVPELPAREALIARARTFELDTPYVPPPGDPLEHVFDRPRDIGMLAIEPQSSQRIRINGIAQREGDLLVVTTEQVLGNCPKYLQQRVLRPDAPKIVDACIQLMRA